MGGPGPDRRLVELCPDRQYMHGWTAMTKKRIATVTGIVVALSVMALVLPVIEVRRDMGWMCAVCRSMKYEKHWAFGVRSSPTHQRSPLEDRMIRCDGPHDHDWRHVQGTGIDALGRPRSSMHGRAPPILFLPRELVEQFATTASDEEVSHFRQVMASGSVSEQEHLVESIVEKFLQQGGQPQRPAESGSSP